MRSVILSMVALSALFEPSSKAAGPDFVRLTSFHKEKQNDPYATERIFHFQHRYALQQKERSRLLETIRQVLEEGSVFGPRQYVQYVRKYDQATMFATEFGASSDSVACLIEVDSSGERDRYLSFSISTAVKAHLRIDRAAGEEQENQAESLIANKVEAAIFQALDR